MPWYSPNPTASVTEAAVAPPTGDTELFESNTLSLDAARKLASKFGLDIQYTKDGALITVPKYVATQDNVISFIDYWTSSAKSDSRLEAERRKRYEHYNMMDKVMGESMIMLDTYADEALSTGFVLDPIEITINDKEAQRGVLEILRRNKLFEHMRSITRNLIKWGDLGFQIRFGDKLEPFRDALAAASERGGGLKTERTMRRGLKDPSDVDPNSYDPANMSIDIHTPEVWEIKLDEHLRTTIFYKYDATVPYATKDTEVSPLSFVQMSLPDDQMFPYGRSILDPLRTIFDQLSTIEALLAISRASRVERLIVKVPTTTDNPTAALSQLQTARGQWKNMIFTDSATGKRSYPRTPSLTDIILIPAMEGFDIAPLKPSIDIASIADVEFFRDKAITLTGLPKGYFKTDESDSWGSGSALVAQDLKFARKLIPIQNALAQGITKLAMVVAAYLGYDIRALDIKTKIKRPIQISGSILEAYTNVSRSARMILEDYAAFSPIGENGLPIEAPTQEAYRHLIRAFGMSEDIVTILEKGLPAVPTPELVNRDNSNFALQTASTYSSRDVLASSEPKFKDNLVRLFEQRA